MIGVYWIIHQKSGKIYIGSTGNFDVRKQIHIRSLIGGYHFNKELQRDYNHDPILSFKFFETQTKNDALKLEQIHLDQYFETGCLYNLSSNAKAPILGGCDLGRNEDWRRNQSIAHNVYKKLVEIKGIQYESITSAARQLGLHKMTISYRLQSENFPDWKLL